MADVSGEDQAAAEFARRWISAVQAMGNQTQRRQEMFQQMSRQLMEQTEQQQQAFKALEKFRVSFAGIIVLRR